MQTRPFGKTGARLPIPSLGCQPLVDEEECSEEQAVAILNTALDRGASHFDTARSCSAG
jgi:aryl-alcohol dehydrogenase-like predicted oxidoreductase